jgi:hypothetical protein
MTISHESVFKLGVCWFYFRKPTEKDILSLNIDELVTFCTEVKMLECPVDWDDFFKNLPYELYLNLLMSDIQFSLSCFPEREKEIFEYHLECRGLDEVLKDTAFSSKIKESYSSKINEEQEKKILEYIQRTYTQRDIDKKPLLRHYIKTNNMEGLKLYAENNNFFSTK